jgi:hypothetical protein
VALSEDQKAMLRLLAQREQGYEDIAALMGLSVDQVRAKVKTALAEMDQPGKTPPESAAVAGPRSEVKSEPATEARHATSPNPPGSGQEAALEPAAPDKPVPPIPTRARSAPARIRLPKDQRLLAAGLGGAVAVILILIVTFSSGSSSPAGTQTSRATATNPATSSSPGSNSKLTEAVLSPVNGGSASGRALFGRIHSTPILQVEARGLDPSPRGQSYTVWLYRSPKLVLRVGAVKVGKSGGIAAQFPIPTQLLAYVASGAFNQIDISLTPEAAYAAEVARAKKQRRLPQYTGTDVLRGQITGPAVKK